MFSPQLHQGSVQQGRPAKRISKQFRGLTGLPCASRSPSSPFTKPVPPQLSASHAPAPLLPFNRPLSPLTLNLSRLQSLPASSIATSHFLITSPPPPFPPHVSVLFLSVAFPYSRNILSGLQFILRIASAYFFPREYIRNIFLTTWDAEALWPPHKTKDFAGWGRYNPGTAIIHFPDDEAVVL
ncbi:hypothetical protein E2C01_042769 [Portunus trituberculatus]|uniref:Uncharacterized protein n=1 Tax=Portunus trituberculatus TaxID=210409 RepID=A0A5B7FR37_PORTR|nr:hypothetical protein [Portunus trituberculatus]